MHLIGYNYVADITDLSSFI